MIRTILTGLVAASLSVGAAQAQIFQAINRVPVTPLADESFQISKDAGYGARGMWCAAADYAHDVLNAPRGARLYISQPRETGRGPVGFSLTAPNRGPEQVAGLSTNVVILGTTLRNKGANLSVGHAMGFCDDIHRSRSR